MYIIYVCVITICREIEVSSGMEDMNITKTSYLEMMYIEKVPMLLMRNDPKISNQYLIAYTILLNQVSEEEMGYIKAGDYDSFDGFLKRSELRYLVLDAANKTEYLPMDDHFQQLGFVLKLITV